jgi:hypothetical protein
MGVLYTQLTDLYVLLEYEKFTLWELPDKLNVEKELTKVLPEDSPDNEKLNNIISSCTILEDLLIPISEPSTFIRKVKNLFCDRTLGYFDYVL